MFVIIDCGSTKADWRLVIQKDEYKDFKVRGFNSLFASEDEISAYVREDVGQFLGAEEAGKVDNVYFYGAGCVSEEVCDKVKRSLCSVFVNAQIEVATDMLGAARATCGRKPGIACILGTGSNSCYYDGEKIDFNVPSLGYILGDEGSGASLGKVFVNHVMKEMFPSHWNDVFKKDCKLDVATVIEHVYRQPNANRYLASFVPYIHAHIHCGEIEQMVVDEFKKFFSSIGFYARVHPEIRRVHFVGSVAHHFRQQLLEAALNKGWEVEQICQSPMEGLTHYHLEML